jgi:hypothetical protein
VFEVEIFQACKPGRFKRWMQQQLQMSLFDGEAPHGLLLGLLKRSSC